MPDVIANHKSKAQRLSGRNVAPVQSFKWSISTKQTFKQLVDMHLRNMRFDVDVRFDADEKEMKARVETYLAKLIKSLVSVWPSGEIPCEVNDNTLSILIEICLMLF